jgi:hypothetical protein
MRAGAYTTVGAVAFPTFGGNLGVFQKSPAVYANVKPRSVIAIKASSDERHAGSALR